MQFRLLTNFELYLDRALPDILSIPSTVTFFELSDKPEKEAAKYIYSISGRDLSQIYQSLFDFVRGLDFELLYPKSKYSLYDSGYDAYFQSLAEMSLSEISDIDTLKRVFLCLLEIRRQKKTQELNEKDALALLPEEVSAFWKELADEGEIILTASEGNVILTADYYGGKACMILPRAKLSHESPVNVDKKWAVQ